MAKYTIEVDTSAKSAKILVDGSEAKVNSASISFYDSQCYYSGEPKRCTYLSWSESTGDKNLAVNHSIMFDSELDMGSDASVGRKITEAVQAGFATKTLEKALGGKNKNK